MKKTMEILYMFSLVPVGLMAGLVDGILISPKFKA